MSARRRSSSGEHDSAEPDAGTHRNILFTLNLFTSYNRPCVLGTVLQNIIIWQGQGKKDEFSKWVKLPTKLQFLGSVFPTWLQSYLLDFQKP